MRLRRGGSSARTPPAISVSLTPSAQTNIDLGQTLNLTASVSNGILAAVNANYRFRESVEGATGEGRTAVADRTVRAGAEVVIESESGKLPVAVIHLPVPPRRSISECIALLPEDSTAVMDADFAMDVEAAIESHREPLEPPAWD